jgi:type VII secretion integral membrane protein EccD
VTSAVPQPAYCRVSLLAPRARVDVALPADVPVAELVPMVLELVGEPVFGLRPQPWRLSGPGGAPLPPQATLAQLGVLDGELLRIAPDAPPPPPPVFDDPVDALAATAGGAGRPDRRFGASVVLVVATAAALLLAAGAVSVAVRATLAGLAAIAAIAHTAWLARRVPEEHGQLAARTTAVAAVPLAAAAGWAATEGTSTALRIAVAAGAAATAAAGAQIALRVVAPMLVATVAVAIPVGLAALTVLWFGVGTSEVAAAVAALALVTAPLLPRAALRLAGLPRPVVPTDGAEFADAGASPDVLDPEELAERSALARGYLAGLVGGCAAVASTAAIIAATSGGWAEYALVAVTVASLVLRSRGFADRGPAWTLLSCAVVGGIGLAAMAAAQPHPVVPLVAATILLTVAVTGVLMLGRAELPGSPVARRALDLLDGVLVAAAVPLALAAMDLFQWVRSW